MSSPTLAPAVRIVRPWMPDSEKQILMPLEIRLMAFASYLTPDLEAELRKEFAEYLQQESFPMLVGNRLIDRICETSLAAYSINKAREMLGYAYVKQYQASLVGVLLASPEAESDFDWLMEGLPRNYSNATNFGTYSITKLGARHWQFEFEDDPGYPDFILGSLISGGELIGVPNNQVSYRVPELGHIVFDIQWG